MNSIKLWSEKFQFPECSDSEFTAAIMQLNDQCRLIKFSIRLYSVYVTGSITDITNDEEASEQELNEENNSGTEDSQVNKIY